MRKAPSSFRFPFLVVTLSILAAAAMHAAGSAFAQGPWSWVTVKPAGENFSVRMPKQPSQEPVEMPNMPGLRGTAYSATGGKFYFTVKSIQAGRGGSPQSRLNDFIAKIREGLSQTSLGARLTDGSPVHLSGFSGQHYRISTQRARARARLLDEAADIRA